MSLHLAECLILVLSGLLDTAIAFTIVSINEN